MSEDDFKADATYAILQDPSSYDHETHGPPYLPSQKTAAVRPMVRGMLRQAAVGKAAHFYKVVEAQRSAYAGQPYAELASILVLLRALAVIHQSNHWATSGASYYSDHLLFDRLYGDLVEEIDKVAEKAVGMGSSSLVNPVTLAKQVSDAVAELCKGLPPEVSPAAMIQLSLEAEMRFLLMTQALVKVMKEAGTLSRGVDNLLAAIEDKHEEHVYLLKQRSIGDPWKTL